MSFGNEMAIFGWMVVLGFGREEAHVAAIGIVVLVTGLIGGCELAVFDEFKKTVAVDFVGFFRGSGMAPDGRLLGVAGDGCFAVAGAGLLGSSWYGERGLLDDVVCSCHDEFGRIG